MSRLAPISTAFVQQAYRSLSGDKRPLASVGDDAVKNISHANVVADPADKQAMKQLLPLFNHLIARQAGVPDGYKNIQDLLNEAVNGAGSDRHPYRGFYVVYARALVNKFADCLQRHCAGEDVSADLESLKQAYKMLVNLPCVDGDEYIEFRHRRLDGGPALGFKRPSNDTVDGVDFDGFMANLIGHQLAADALDDAHRQKLYVITEPVKPVRRGRQRTSEEFWNDLNQKVSDANISSGHDLKSLVVSFVNRYSAKKLDRVFSGLNFSQQKHVWDLLGDVNKRFHIPGHSEPVNAMQALVHAAQLPQTTAAQKRQACQIANIALAQLLPDETFTLSAERRRVPAADAPLAAAAQIPLWRRRDAGNEGKVVEMDIVAEAGLAPAHVVSVKYQHAEAKDELAAVRASDSRLGRVYVGLPTQMADDSDLIAGLNGLVSDDEARIERFQTSVLPNPDRAPHGEWVEGDAQQRVLERTVLNHFVANLYFNLAQGKQVVLPERDADGHYNLGLAADSWIQQHHQPFLNRALDQFAALAARMEGASRADQRAALMGLYNGESEGYLAYISAYVAGESSDAVSLDALDMRDEAFKSGVVRQASAGGAAAVEHMCYQPQHQAEDAALCQRGGLAKGDHLLPVDEAALERLRSERHVDSLTRNDKRLDQSLRMAFDFIYKAADRSGDADAAYARLQVKLKEVLGDEGYADFMNLAISDVDGRPMLSAAALDECFADVMSSADKTAQQQVMAIRKALLQPLGDDRNIGQYYSQLLQVMSQQFLLDVKDDAKYKLSADGVAHDSFSAMVSAAGGARPGELFQELPATLLDQHLIAKIKKHNAADGREAKDKVKLETEDCVAGVKAGFANISYKIRDYLNSPSPDEGRLFFRVLIKGSGSAGHFVWLAVDHASKRVMAMDPHLDSEPLLAGQAKRSGELFKECVADLQQQLRQTDPVTMAPAVDGVHVFMEPYQPQTDSVYCGDHLDACLSQMMSTGDEWFSAAEDKVQAAARVSAAVGREPLGAVPVPCVVSLVEACRQNAYDIFQHVPGFDGDYRVDDLYARNLQKLTTDATGKYEPHLLEKAARLLTDRKIDLSGIARNSLIRSSRLANLIKAAKQYASLTPNSQPRSSAVHALRQSFEGKGELAAGVVVAQREVSAQRTHLLVKNKQLLLSPQGQNLFNVSNWLDSAWLSIRNYFGRRGDEAEAKTRLALALANGCAEAGIDLSKVGDPAGFPGSLPGELQDVLRKAAQTVDCKVITEALLESKATEQQRHDLVAEHNGNEFNLQRYFWKEVVRDPQAARTINDGAFRNEWLTEFNSYDIDMTALRTDPHGEALLSHWVHAHNQLQRALDPASNTPYVYQQQLRDQFAQLGRALSHYQQAVRAANAYDGDSAEEQQALLDTVERRFAAFDKIGKSVCATAQQAAAVRNRECARTREFRFVTEILSGGGEDFDNTGKQYLLEANKRGIDLTSCDWRGVQGLDVTVAGVTCTVGEWVARPIAPAPAGGGRDARALPQVVRNACIAAIYAHSADIKTIDQARKQVAQVSSAEPPVSHAWNAHAVSRTAWRTNCVTWAQRLQAAPTAKFNRDEPTWSADDFKSRALAAAAALRKRDASAPDVVIPAGDSRHDDLVAIEASNLAVLSGFADAAPPNIQLPELYHGVSAEAQARRVMLAKFTAVMGVDLAQVDRAVFSRSVAGDATQFTNEHMQQLMQYAEPFMAANGAVVDAQLMSVADIAATQALIADPGLSAAAIAHRDDLAVRNSVAVQDGRFARRLPPLPGRLAATRKLEVLANRAGIDLQSLLGEAGAAARVALVNRAVGFNLNKFEIDHHKDFYVDLYERMNPVDGFEVDDFDGVDERTDVANRIQSLANHAGMDLAQLRSTPEGLQVLEQWLQGINIAVYQDCLQCGEVDEDHLAPLLQRMTAAVVAYQQAPTPAHLDAVKVAKRVLKVQCQEQVATCNRRVLLSRAADLNAEESGLLDQVDAFVTAFLTHQAGGAAPDADAVTRLRTQLCEFLNAHGHVLPYNDDWPGAGEAIDVTAGAHARLSDLLISAQEYAQLTQSADTVYDMTAEKYQRETTRIEAVAKAQASVAEWSLALENRAGDLPHSLVSDTSTDKTNEEHLAMAASDSATNADHWWELMSKTSPVAGFVLTDKDSWLANLNTFCGDEINLNRLVRQAETSGDGRRAVRQMLRVMIQQQHGIFPVSSNADVTAYKSALTTYINAADVPTRAAAFNELQSSYFVLMHRANVSGSRVRLVAYNAVVPSDPRYDFGDTDPTDVHAGNIDDSNRAELAAGQQLTAWYARYQSQTNPDGRQAYANPGAVDNAGEFAERLRVVAAHYNIELKYLHVGAVDSDHTAALFLQAFSQLADNADLAAGGIDVEVEQAFQAIAEYTKAVKAAAIDPTKDQITDPVVLYRATMLTRHPRLQAHLQQSIEKHIVDNKALDALLQRRYPGTTEEQMPLLRRQVVQYMKRFGITQFDCPSQESITAAYPRDGSAGPRVDLAMCEKWLRIVGSAIEYDATLVAGRRLGVAHDQRAWQGMAAQLRGGPIVPNRQHALSIARGLVAAASRFDPADATRHESNNATALQWAGKYDDVSADFQAHLADFANQAGIALSALGDEDKAQRCLLIALAKKYTDTAPAPNPALTDPEKKAVLLAEVRLAVPLPERSWARVFASEHQDYATPDQVNAGLLELFTRDIPGEAAGSELQPHNLLDHFVDASNEHKEMRAHIMQAVLLTRIAAHAGVDLQNEQHGLLDAIDDCRLYEDGEVGYVDNIAAVRAASTALQQAFQAAVDADPGLKTLMAPGEARQTAAEVEAEHALQRGVMRPGGRSRMEDAYDQMDPRPGTAAYRHQMLQQMRREAAGHTGGLDASAAIPDVAITNADDLEALRRRSAMARHMDSEKDAFHKMMGNMRLANRFRGKDGKLEEAIVWLFNDGDSPREPFQDGKPVILQQVGIGDYTLNVTESNASELHFNARGGSGEKDFKILRKVNHETGGVSFNVVVKSGFKTGVDPAIIANAYAALLAREFYKKDAQGNLQPVAIDIGKIDAKKIFGRGNGDMKPDQVMNLLKDAMKEFHKQQGIEGEVKLNFADKPKPAPKPSAERKEAKPTDPAVQEATQWVEDNVPVSDQMPAEQKQGIKRYLASRPDICKEFKDKAPQEKGPFLQQKLQEAQAQQQAAQRQSQGGGAPTQGGGPRG